ncbi:MAG: hypothetical protein WKF47_13165 [Geodermatophilaceae bacterium]
MTSQTAIGQHRADPDQREPVGRIGVAEHLDRLVQARWGDRRSGRRHRR